MLINLVYPIKLVPGVKGMRYVRIFRLYLFFWVYIYLMESLKQKA